MTIPDSPSISHYMNVRYNALNLPDSVCFTLKGNNVSLLADGGYYSLWNDTLQLAQVYPYFYVTDYLGSVRAVCDGVNGQKLQSLEYTPSGHIFRSENYGLQPRRFCGKELLTIHGWNMYDSSARFQHYSLPRFTSMDPLAEKYYSVSPYAYAMNDYVNFVDPSGKSPIYDIHGKFLGTTKEGFSGLVLIYTGTFPLDCSNTSYSFLLSHLYRDFHTYDDMYAKNLLTSNSLKNIWNDILSYYDGVSVYERTFSISSLYNGGMGSHGGNKYTWLTSTKDGQIKITGSGHHPAYEMTVENTIASLLYHEWYSHGILNIGDNFHNHSKAYDNVINSPIWKNTTQRYKDFNIGTRQRYKDDEDKYYNEFLKSLFK